MSRRTRKRARPKSGNGFTAPPKAGDDTEHAIAELVVLWPRLLEALARDAAGPSAESTSAGSSGAAASAAVVDLDTQRAIIRIEQGVQSVAGETRPLLRIDNPAQVIARAGKMIAQLQAERAAALTAITLVRKQAAWLIKRGQPIRPTTAQQRRAHDAAVAVTRADAEIRRHRARIAEAEHRRSTLGILEQLRDWYPQLRDRQQPLAEHIADDVDGWIGAARAALGLRTHVRKLGRLCPYHRGDHPTELVREGDEASLSAVVMSGRTNKKGQTPMRWRFGNAVRCPHCKQRWVGPEQCRVLMRVIDQADAEDETRTGLPRAHHAASDPVLLSAPLIAIAVGRSDGTIRAWGSSGLLTRHTEIGPPPGNKAVTLYDLDEALGVSRRARRRERGLIALSHVAEVCPEGDM